MKVFLTGTTGYLGSAIAKQLLANGHEVLGHVRTSEAADRVSSLGIVPRLGDVLDDVWLRGELTDVDGAVHAASPNDTGSAAFDGRILDTVLDVFAGTDQRYVHTGGSWIHGSGRRLNEASPYAPPVIVAWRPGGPRPDPRGCQHGTRDDGRTGEPLRSRRRTGGTAGERSDGERPAALPRVGAGVPQRPRRRCGGSLRSCPRTRRTRSLRDRREHRIGADGHAGTRPQRRSGARRTDPRRLPPRKHGTVWGPSPTRSSSTPASTLPQLERSAGHPTVRH
ncbi:NAD-dependent epimerase/dehydratase family protein [Curtobacterium sp. MCPF17_052]|uniref:NAD-dependent epimerase/dehydratase family protein n=1 Tax=Curtobacterium sp. MCPF17_052 TaxID=2175655 RepID=UPI0034647F63